MVCTARKMLVWFIFGDANFAIQSQLAKSRMTSTFSNRRSPSHSNRSKSAIREDVPYDTVSIVVSGRQESFNTTMSAFTSSLPIVLHGRHAPHISGRRGVPHRPRLSIHTPGAVSVGRKFQRMCPRMDSDVPAAPDGSTITQALELTFRAVWVRLMTAGVGAEYSQAIEQFVVACVAAYKAGYSMTALKLELAANEPAGEEAKIMGRDIRLSETEKDTRLIWISLVYLTLARFKFAADSAPQPVERELAGSKLGDIVRGLAGLVDSVTSAAKRGYNLELYKMELDMAEKDTSGSPKSKEVSAAEKSLRSQWSRIIFTTIGILPDSLKGSNDKKD